jgi:hypothetical protein
MDIDQAKWFLQVFTDGKKLNTATIRELYLSGYIGIKLCSPGKEPLPTVITEKGKQVLETRWGTRCGRMQKFSRFALPAGHEASHASGCPAAGNVAPLRVARLMNGC